MTRHQQMIWRKQAMKRIEDAQERVSAAAKERDEQAYLEAHNEFCEAMKARRIMIESFNK